MTRTVGSTATYVRDPSGNLVAQVPASGGPYYYLTDGQGSVAGLVDPSGNQAASYFYCPTGNPADGPFGTAATGNPFQYQSAYYDSSFQSYWMDGQQFDSNSGNAFSLNVSPDQLQGEMLAMGDLGLIVPINPTLATTANPIAGQGGVMADMMPSVSSVANCVGSGLQFLGSSLLLVASIAALPAEGPVSPVGALAVAGTYVATVGTELSVEACLYPDG